MKHKHLPGPFIISRKGKLVFDTGYITDQELNHLIRVLEEERELRIAKMLGNIKQMEFHKLKESKNKSFTFKKSSGKLCS
jgi:hypothetical protein